MEITSTLASSQTTPSPAGTNSGKTAISADFEMFLKMLTVQMKNQDPLDPIDSADYAVQLATFSGVEQQVQTNDLLKEMAAAFSTSGMADMAGWVGMEARSSAPAAFSGQPIVLTPEVDPGADMAQIAVRDGFGREIARLEVPQLGVPLSWSGATSAGGTAPAGLYTFDTISFSGGQQISEAPAQSYSKVSEVQTRDGQTMVILSGGSSVAATEVTALRDPSA